MAVEEIFLQTHFMIIKDVLIKAVSIGDQSPGA